MFRKRLLAAGVAVALAAMACGGGNATNSPAQSQGAGESAGTSSAAPGAALAKDQTLRIDLGSEPPTLDPQLAQDSNSIAVLNNLNRPLMYFDKDLKAVPALAAKVDITPDAKTFTFTLKDAKYSNGDPIVAGDLVYAWRRLLDPRLAAPYAYVLGTGFAPVVGADDLMAMDPKKSTDAQIQAAQEKLGVSAPDDKTFKVQLAAPASYFLSVASLWVTAPVEKKWVETKNFTEAANYVSSGPFKLASWEHNSKLTLVPNENYYGTKPTLQKVEFSMLNDPAAAQAAYEAGELDMVLTPTADIDRVKNDPTMGPEVKIVNALSIAYYGFNTQKAPTSNLDFRIALTQSVDKDTLMKTVYKNRGVIANSFVMPGIPGADPNLNVYPYDVKSAQAHMATALQALGKASVADLGKLSIGFNTGAGHEDIVNFLVGQWQTAFPGIQFDLQGSEFKVFLPQRHKGAYIISRNGWGADYPHASDQLSGLFTCGGGNNDEGYCNKDFDALINQAAAELDQDKQTALYKQAQELLMKDAPILPLRWPAAQFTIKPYVSGLVITPQYAVVPGDQFLETVSILDHQ